MGPLVAIAEYFTEKCATIYIYNTTSKSKSDYIEEYDEEYENLSEDVLFEIELLCEVWETEWTKTWERNSN